MSSFSNAKVTHIFFQQNISVYAIFNDQSFNDTLTNNIIIFEQLVQDFNFFSGRCFMIKFLMF